MKAERIMRMQRGVTVLELLLALAIMALLVVVALPSLQRYLALRDLQQTARQLGTDLRLTQQYGVTQNELFRLEYVSASAQYTLQRVSDGTVVKQVVVPATLTITSTFTSDRVDFTATGAPVQSGAFCVSDGTAILKVDVQPGTGRAQIAEVTTCP